jgi:flagellar basal-body rod protein FlgB
MSILGDTSIGGIQAWLHGLSRRQEAVSNNIANIDTPGYQRQEAPFEAELKRAMGTGPGHLTTTDPRHISAPTKLGSGQAISSAQLLSSARRDGNDVSIDHEMVTMAETQMRYQAAASALNTKIGILRNVIRGG